ncbi:MAG: Hint domain-containing protein [Pelagimonas sp.]|nr:Hint domain-containing protein [Pelagimonas sp.]
MPTMTTGLGGPAGYGENTFSSVFFSGSLPRTGNLDDGSLYIDVTSVFGPAGIDFFGTSYTGLYLNTNGLITFGSPNTAYTPSGIAGLSQPAIAPLWTDYDLRKGGEIYWDEDPVAGTFTITWLDAAPYSTANASGTNSFQVVLTARTNPDGTPNGGFIMDVIYEDIQFANGYTGNATLGVTNGSGTVIEPAASGNGAAVLDIENNDVNDHGDGILHIGFSDGGTPTCFLPGTLIETPRGPVAIERLQAGDLVQTHDNGWQPVLWISATTHIGGRHTHVRFRKGVLGTSRDLLVSPAHRMLLTGHLPEMLCGSAEILAPARQLVNGTDVLLERSDAPVTYYHLMLARHDMVLANDSWSESYFPGEQALGALSLRSRAALSRSLSKSALRKMQNDGLCRLQAKGYEARLLSRQIADLAPRSTPDVPALRAIA